MTTRKWRPRICKGCGDHVKVYRFLGRFSVPFISYTINWCRTCQRRLLIGEWEWGER
jgi:hypothetical protein